MKNFKEVINTICPDSLQESWDNSGFQIKTDNREIKKILVTLEITEKVLDYGISEKVDAIVTHHPLIFTSMTEIDAKQVPGKYIFGLIKNEISVISCHTSFDRMEGGNNDYIGKLMGMTEIKTPEEQDGFLKTGTIEVGDFGSFITKVKKEMNLTSNDIRFVGDVTAPCKKVGWCTGAGKDFIQAAYNCGCDTFVTGDIGYHDAVWACEMGMNLLDIGHYGSEKIFTENMAEKIRDEYRKRGLDIEVIEKNETKTPFNSF